MPLTPADIHNMAFKKSSVGRRGYDEEQVDALLDAVTQEMIQLLEENDLLRDRARRSAAAAPVNTGGTELAAAADELNRVRRACDRAEQTASSLRTRLDGVRRAAPVPAVPDPGIERVLAVAQRTAEQHLQGAHQAAAELLGDAREQSERITRDARRTAHDITENSRLRGDAAEAETQDTHTALQRQVTELAEFAENYRAALHDHIFRQGQF